MIDIQGLPSDIELIVVNPETREVVNTEFVENYYPRASVKRKREFLLGRLCAHDALLRFGLKNFSVPVGMNREPIWPSGFVGSITHCEGLCAAAVARSTCYCGLGIDAEPDGVLPVEIHDLILSQRDKVWLQSASSAGRDMKIIFSAKEAVYKCLYPLVNRFIDFCEVDVRLAKERQQFVAYLPADIAHIIGTELLHGAIFWSERHFLTAAFMKQERVSGYSS